MRRVPCKLAIAVIALSLAVEEWYPLSNFPMFADAHGSSWYVYVTDGQDELVDTNRQFGMSPTFVKKVFLQERKDARERIGGGRAGRPAADAEAGRHLLAYMVEHGKPKRRKREQRDDPTLKLWKTTISIEGDHLERARRVLAVRGAP